MVQPFPQPGMRIYPPFVIIKLANSTFQCSYHNFRRSLLYLATYNVSRHFFSFQTISHCHILTGISLPRCATASQSAMRNPTKVTLLPPSVTFPADAGPAIRKFHRSYVSLQPFSHLMSFAVQKYIHISVLLPET